MTTTPAARARLAAGRRAAPGSLRGDTRYLPHLPTPAALNGGVRGWRAVRRAINTTPVRSSQESPSHAPDPRLPLSPRPPPRGSSRPPGPLSPRSSAWLRRPRLAQLSCSTKSRLRPPIPLLSRLALWARGCKNAMSHQDK